jgi:glutathione synthase
MRLAFVVDPLRSMDPSIDTTVGLIRAGQARGFETWVATPEELEAVDGRARAHAERIRLADPGNPGAWYTVTARADVWLDETSAVFMRPNPPVDGRYLAATLILDLVDADRTTMVNDPRGLRAWHEKITALQYPDLVPPTIVSASGSVITSFVRDHRRAVLKPVDGFAGRGVLVLDVADPNLTPLIELSTDLGRRAVIVQRYLPEVAGGNKRVFVVDGRPTAAVWRYPKAEDFRIGDPVGLAPVTRRDRQICARLTPGLSRDGLRMVGLDVIGEFLIEVNVTSPGALGKSDALLGTTLCAELVDSITSPSSRTEQPCPSPSCASASSAHLSSVSASTSR